MRISVGCRCWNW